MTTTGPTTLDTEVIWKCHLLDMPAIRVGPSRPLGGEHGNEPVTQSGTGFLLAYQWWRLLLTPAGCEPATSCACASAIAAGTGALAQETICRCHQAVLSHTIWTYLVLHGTLTWHGCPSIHWQDPRWVWIDETDAMLGISMVWRRDGVSQDYLSPGCIYASRRSTQFQSISRLAGRTDHHGSQMPVGQA